MVLRIVIFLLRRVLGGLVGIVVFTILGRGRLAHRTLRWGRRLSRLVGL